jgi:hypothetical protein
MTPRPFDEYRDTPLWNAVESTLNELVASREIAVNTAPEYVIGYLCRQLQAKKLVIATSVER